MQRRDRALVARLVVMLICFLGGCTATAPINLSGTWVGQITWISGPASGLSSLLQLDLSHEGSSLHGTITLSSSGQQTFDITIDNGRSTGYTLNLHASGTNDLVNPPATVLLDLAGGFDSQNMAGTGTQTVNGAEYDIEWSATLVSPDGTS
jgi:hypothetical protein